MGGVKNKIEKTLQRTSTTLLLLLFWSIFFSCISTLGWWIFVFFRILLWVDTIFFFEAYFCVLSCYLIYYLWLLNVILLRNIAKIIWCLLLYISFLLIFFSSYFIQNLNSAISSILLNYLYFISFLFKKLKI